MVAQGTSYQDHGHTHEHMDHPGFFEDREPPMPQRDLSERGFTVGIGGPVGSGCVFGRGVVAIFRTVIMIEF